MSPSGPSKRADLLAGPFPNMDMESMRQTLIALLRELGFLPVADEFRFWFTVMKKHGKNRAFKVSHPTESFPLPDLIRCVLLRGLRKLLHGGRRRAEVVMK